MVVVKKRTQNSLNDLAVGLSSNIHSDFKLEKTSFDEGKDEID